MKPMSAFKHYRYNKKKLLLLIVPVFLSITLLYCIQMLISSFFSWEYDAFVETRKYYTSIQTKGSLIDTSIISEIEKNENTKKVVPCVTHFTYMDTFIDRVGVRVYTMYNHDLIELMNTMGLKLVEGRLPSSNESEIVIHKDLASNKNFSIGDRIGNDKNPSEVLIGDYLIVGIIDGKPLACFSSLEYWENKNNISNPSSYGILIYPKANKLTELNQYIQYLPLNGNYISNYNISRAEFKQSMDKINIILNTIYISVIIILSLSIGFLTYLFYIGKSKEFAILNVIGYSKHFIIKSNFKVLATVNLLVTISAIGTSLSIGLLLNSLVFVKMGTPLVLISLQILLPSLCVPLLSITSEILSIWLVFDKLDPISIVEIENI